MQREFDIAVIAGALADDPRDAARLARDAGFDALSFDLRTRGLDFTQLSLTGQREFHKLLSSNRLKLAAIRGPADPGIAPGPHLDRAVAAAEATIRAAASIRAAVATVELGAAAQAGDFAAPLAHLASIADRHGVIVALSNAACAFTVLHDALAAAACSWFGVDFHPAFAGDWSTSEVMNRLGALIRHVSAEDPARSRVNWQDILNNLRGASYRGAITIDTQQSADPPRAAIAALSLLRDRTSTP